MKLFKGCLLCCDVDGTLVHDGVIPPDNIEKIKFFSENGGIFALATGRSIGAVSAITSKIEGISKAVFSNGGMIYDYERRKIVFETAIPKEDYEIMYKAKELFPDIGIEVHYKENVRVFNKTAETDDHERYENLPSDAITKEQTEKITFNKILYTLNGKDDIEKMHKFVESNPHVCKFIDTSAFLYGRKRYYYEQVPKEISKAASVKRLADMLGIKKGNLFAIGDYYNDFEMLKIADIGAAPNTAPKEIKEIANYVTASAENGAVADFIDYLTDLRRK
ncbi:MAG: HAD family hydrolase [Clostridia bacterium]|nr:HAD family hydrolase [Clostridia bacterium]